MPPLLPLLLLFATDAGSLLPPAALEHERTEEQEDDVDTRPVPKIIAPDPRPPTPKKEEARTDPCLVLGAAGLADAVGAAAVGGGVLLAQPGCAAVACCAICFVTPLAGAAVAQLSDRPDQTLPIATGGFLGALAGGIGGVIVGTFTPFVLRLPRENSAVDYTYAGVGTFAGAALGAVGGVTLVAIGIDPKYDAEDDAAKR